MKYWNKKIIKKRTLIHGSFASVILLFAMFLKEILK